MRRIGPVSHQLRRDLLAALHDLPEGPPVLVACSGGPDSLALAAVTAATDRPAGAVVVDHGLQPGSDAVAARAEQQCRQLGLDPVIGVAVTVAGERAGGPEAAARQARYAALERAATEHGAAAVLLAHTLDDQAESVLLGLVRGSGTRSLAGIPPARGVFRRPWLGRRRSTIIDALAEFGLTPWHDPHNDDPALLRSRLRHRVLPVLAAELGPGVVDALARTASLSRQDADALDAWAVQQWQVLGDPPWPVAQLAALPAAVRTRLIRAALLAAGAPATDVTAAHVSEVDRMVTHWHGQGPVSLPAGVRAARRCGRLTIDRDADRSTRWGRMTSATSSPRY